MAEIIERDGKKYCVEPGGYEWVYTPSVPLLTLDEIKSQKVNELQSIRDTEIYSSFKSSAVGSEKTYNYERQAADNFRSETALLALDTSIKSVLWATVEDGLIEHTRQQFTQVVRDSAVHNTSCQMKYFQLESQVKAATTQEEIDAVQW